MSIWHCPPQLLPVAAIVFASIASPVSAQSAPPPPSRQAAANLLPANPLWVVNFDPLPERSAPSEESDPIATLRQFTYLAVLGYDGEWARVFNPRTKEVGFVPSEGIGPTDAPPAYITADPPPTVDQVDMVGRTLRGAPLTFYP